MSESQTTVSSSSSAAIAPLSPSEVDFMPALLRSFSILIRLKGKHVSPQFLLAGLSGSEKISVGACLRAAERAGLKGKVMYRPSLDNISPLTMPCVLLLKDNASCVLTSLDADKAEVILPELGDGVQTVPRKELESQYSGYVVFGALETRVDARTEPVRLGRSRHWFWDVLRFYMPIYRHVALASVVVNIIAVASSLFVMNVYDRVIPNNAYETLWVLAAGVTLAYLFDFILRSLRSHFVDLAGRNADVVLSSRLIDKVLSMRMDAKPESTGALVNNLREFESLREFFSSTTLLACIDIPFLLLFFALLAFIGGPLVLLPLMAVPVLLGVACIFRWRPAGAPKKSYRHNMQKNALLVEMVNGLETVKGCMAESRMQRLWEAVAGISAQSSNEARKYSTRAVTFATFTTQLVTVGMVIWGVYRIGAGEMSMGGLIGWQHSGGPHHGAASAARVAAYAAPEFARLAQGAGRAHAAAFGKSGSGRLHGLRRAVQRIRHGQRELLLSRFPDAGARSRVAAHPAGRKGGHHRENGLRQEFAGQAAHRPVSSVGGLRVHSAGWTSASLPRPIFAAAWDSCRRKSFFSTERFATTSRSAIPPSTIISSSELPPFPAWPTSCGSILPDTARRWANRAAIFPAVSVRPWGWPARW